MIVAQRLASALLSALLLQSFSARAGDPEWAIEVDQRGGTFIIEATINFPVPVHSAWEVLTDFDHMTTILSNLTTSRIVSRNANTLRVEQEGVAKYGFFSYAFASEREIRLEPMKRIVARQLSGNARSFVSELLLSPAGSGSAARYHAEMVPASGLARTFGGPFIKHEIEEQFSAMAAEMVRRKAP